MNALKVLLLVGGFFLFLFIGVVAIVIAASMAEPLPEAKNYDLPEYGGFEEKAIVEECREIIPHLNGEDNLIEPGIALSRYVQEAEFRLGAPASTFSANFQDWLFNKEKLEFWREKREEARALEEELNWLVTYKLDEKPDWDLIKPRVAEIKKELLELEQDVRQRGELLVQLKREIDFHGQAIANIYLSMRRHAKWFASPPEGVLYYDVASDDWKTRAISEEYWHSLVMSPGRDKVLQYALAGDIREPLFDINGPYEKMPKLLNRKSPRTNFVEAYRLFTSYSYYRYGHWSFYDRPLRPDDHEGPDAATPFDEGDHDPDAQYWTRKEAMIYWYEANVIMFFLGDRVTQTPEDQEYRKKVERLEKYTNRRFGASQTLDEALNRTPENTPRPLRLGTGGYVKIPCGTRPQLAREGERSYKELANKLMNEGREAYQQRWEWELSLSPKKLVEYHIDEFGR